MTGSILFSYRKVGTKEIHQKEITSPALIEVAPYVTHKVKALTDVIFLEANSIQAIRNDRIKEEV